MTSDFSDLTFSLSSIIDRNLGIKFLEFLSSTAKVITMIDFYNIRVEFEALVVALNRVNMQNSSQIIFILPEILDFSCIFILKDIEKAVDVNFFKQKFKQIGSQQIKAILKKFEVFLRGS